MKTFAIALLAGASLSGCVAVPAYGPSPYGYGPPVVVAPVIGFGYGYGGRGYYGGRGRW